MNASFIDDLAGKLTKSVAEMSELSDISRGCRPISNDTKDSMRPTVDSATVTKLPRNPVMGISVVDRHEKTQISAVEWRVPSLVQSKTRAVYHPTFRHGGVMAARKLTSDQKLRPLWDSIERPDAQKSWSRPSSGISYFRNNSYTPNAGNIGKRNIPPPFDDRLDDDPLTKVEYLNNQPCLKKSPNTKSSKKSGRKKGRKAHSADAEKFNISLEHNHTEDAKIESQSRYEVLVNKPIRPSTASGLPKIRSDKPCCGKRPQSANAITWRKSSSTQKKAPIFHASNDDDSYDTMLALTLFEDSYERKSPFDWLELGKTLGLEGTPAFSRYRIVGNDINEWEWSSCLVVTYDPSKKLYQIKWPMGNQKWVNRLNLYFADENRESYFSHLESAIQTKNQLLEELENEKNITNHKLSFSVELPIFLKLGALHRLGRKISHKELPIIVYLMINLGCNDE